MSRFEPILEAAVVQHYEFFCTYDSGVGKIPGAVLKTLELSLTQHRNLFSFNEVEIDFVRVGVNPPDNKAVHFLVECR